MVLMAQIHNEDYYYDIVRRNIKNLLHFINPSKYEAVLGGESVSISFGNGAEPIDNDKDNLSDGARTTFKF